MFILKIYVTCWLFQSPKASVALADLWFIKVLQTSINNIRHIHHNLLVITKPPSFK